MTTFRHGFVGGLAAFGAFILASLLWTAVARCEAPPLIGDVPRARSVTEGVRQRPVAQPSSLVCEAPSVAPPTRLAVLTAEPATEAERRLIGAAVEACARVRGAPVRVLVDPWQALALVRLGDELGAPEGLLLATWCVEVSMRPEARAGGRFHGDYRDGVPLASGPYQLLEGTWGGVCGGTAAAPHDLVFAASCYWRNVDRVARSRAGELSRCSRRVRLRAAEAAASNVRRYGVRCDSESAHWRMLNQVAAEVRRKLRGTR